MFRSGLQINNNNTYIPEYNLTGYNVISITKAKWKKNKYNSKIISRSMSHIISLFIVI